MFSSTMLIAAAAAGLLIGLGAGWVLGRQRRPEHRGEIQDLQQRIEQAADDRRQYEADVREHFVETANLLNRLTDDYRSVYQHIAKGAEDLCDEEVALQTDALAQSRDDEIPPRLVDVQQPLDYAPRKNPDEQGQLSEDFGLEKAKTPDVEEPMRATA